jgi:hypothetical protein
MEVFIKAILVKEGSDGLVFTHLCRNSKGEFYWYDKKTRMMMISQKSKTVYHAVRVLRGRCRDSGYTLYMESK